MMAKTLDDQINEAQLEKLKLEHDEIRGRVANQDTKRERNIRLGVAVGIPLITAVVALGAAFIELRRTSENLRDIQKQRAEFAREQAADFAAARRRAAVRLLSGQPDDVTAQASLNALLLSGTPGIEAANAAANWVTHDDDEIATAAGAVLQQVDDRAVGTLIEDALRTARGTDRIHLLELAGALRETQGRENMLDLIDNADGVIAGGAARLAAEWRLPLDDLTSRQRGFYRSDGPSMAVSLAMLAEDDAYRTDVLAQVARADGNPRRPPSRDGTITERAICYLVETGAASPSAFDRAGPFPESPEARARRIARVGPTIRDLAAMVAGGDTDALTAALSTPAAWQSAADHKRNEYFREKLDVELPTLTWEELLDRLRSSYGLDRIGSERRVMRRLFGLPPELLDIASVPNDELRRLLPSGMLAISAGRGLGSEPTPGAMLGALHAEARRRADADAIDVQSIPATLEPWERLLDALNSETDSQIDLVAEYVEARRPAPGSLDAVAGSYVIRKLVRAMTEEESAAFVAATIGPPASSPGSEGLVVPRRPSIIGRSRHLDVLAELVPEQVALALQAHDLSRDDLLWAIRHGLAPYFQDAIADELARDDAPPFQGRSALSPSFVLDRLALAAGHADRSTLADWREIVAVFLSSEALDWSRPPPGGGEDPHRVLFERISAEFTEAWSKTGCGSYPFPPIPELARSALLAKIALRE